MNRFGPGEATWIARLGNLRNVVRQELIARQLALHVQPGMRVLDVGCGQGTQALRLAAMGCDVVGIDPSESLLSLLSQGAADGGLRVETHVGRVETLTENLDGDRFDLVCAHGLLMYFEDRRSVLEALAAHVASPGLLSFTFRNGAALAFRPGMRRDWSAALGAFDTATYTNELGVKARADRLDDVEHDLEMIGFRVAAWYGVRIFTDPANAEEPPPGTKELEALLAAEERAAAHDPYRQMA